MIVKTPQEIGQYVRKKRKEQSLTQTDLANICGVGERFISEMENGKITAQIGKVLHVISVLGIKLDIS